MPGQKCQYKDCPMVHNYDSKSENRIRFFHFPVKDPARCEKWITNAQKPEFHSYPLDKLKTKLICAYHFEQRCFYNYRRDKLVHFAVPTLNYPNSKDFASAKNEISFKNQVSMDSSNYELYEKDPLSDTTTNVEIVFLKNELDNFDDIVLVNKGKTKGSSDYTTKIKTEIDDDLSLVAVGNDESTFVIDFNQKPESKPSPRVGRPIKHFGKNNSQVKKTNLNSSFNVLLNSIEKVVESNECEETSKDKQKIEKCVYRFDQNGQLNLLSDDDATKNSKNEKSMNEEILKKINSNTKQIGEIKKMLETFKPRKRAQNKYKMNKVALYRCVAKHVSPTLARVIKMNMFPKYKTNNLDKMFAYQLWTACGDGYDLLQRKWNWKLPSSKELEGWARIGLFEEDNE